MLNRCPPGPGERHLDAALRADAGADHVVGWFVAAGCAPS